MTKESYLQALESLLKKHMSKSEIDDILRDYGEHFDDGRRQNKTDIEISAKLGNPQTIAQQLIEEYGDKNKTEKLDQTLHSIKENTEKTFASLKKGTEKTISTLKKGTEKTFRSTSDKMASFDSIDSAKQGVSTISHSVKKGTNHICSIIKSILLFCIFAFLQILFIIVVYSFCITATLSLIGFGIFGIFCLGFSFSFLPLLLSISILFAVIALFALGSLFGLLTVYILKKNIFLIKNYILKRQSNMFKKEGL